MDRFYAIMGEHWAPQGGDSGGLEDDTSDSHRPVPKPVSPPPPPATLAPGPGPKAPQPVIPEALMPPPPVPATVRFASESLPPLPSRDCSDPAEIRRMIAARAEAIRLLAISSVYTKHQTKIQEVASTK